MWRVLSIFLVFFSALAFSADSIQIGQSHQVPGWRWVTVVNSGGVRNGNVHFSEGRSCGIQEGGSVKVIDFSGDSVLLSYSLPGAKPFGTACPSGTRFYLSAEELSRFNSKSASNRLKRHLLNEVVTDILAGATGTPSDSLQVGQVHTVPNWQWVKVMNKDGVENGNSTKEFQGSCGIEEGGKVKILGFSETEGVLVRYSTGVKYGSPCPSGTLFFLEPKKLAKFNDEYDQVLRRRKALRRNITRILSGNSKIFRVRSHRLGDVRKVSKWQWVTVMNLDGIRNGNGPFPFEDRCGIKTDGSVEIIGFSADKTKALLRYSVRGKQFGTPCPSGVIFFLEVGSIDEI